MHLSIKVLEFKLNPTIEQQQKFEVWMENLKSVWNRALRQLINLDNYSWRYAFVDENNKTSYAIAHCCPIWDFYKYYENEQVGIIRDRGAKKDGIKLDAPYCPLNEDLTDARGFKEFYIKNDSYFGLQETIKSDRIKDAPWIEEIPYKIRSGALKDLSVSWQEYKKSLIAFGKAKKNKAAQPVIFRGCPKFKGKRDKIRTLTHPNPKESIFPVENDILKGFPKTGELKVKGLSKRWKDDFGNIPLISVAKIIKRGNKWFIQLTGEFQQKAPKIGDRVIKPKASTIGIDVGVRCLYASDGQETKPIRPLKAFIKSERRLKRLQRKVDRKKTKRLLLWLQSATKEKIKDICKRMSDERAIAIASNPPCQVKDLKKIIGRIDKGNLLTNEELQILKHSLPVSKKEKKVLDQISALHDKIRRQRRAYAHKHSTFVVRSHGTIKVEDLKVSQLIKKPDVSRNSDGTYNPNNANLQTKFNKYAADAGMGMFLELLKKKSAIAGRTFSKVPCKNTTQECSNCGEIVRKDLSAKLHKCPYCGFVIDRKINAARNIKKRE